MTEMTGGCLCGRIRYTADIADDEAYLCHCRMCQRASGNVSLALKNVRKADVGWTLAPAYYESSPIARRGFCAHCGSSLSFEYHDSERMDLTVGSFDDPGYFRLTEHSGVESIHRAWIDTPDVPEYRTEQNEALAQRWIKALGKIPD